jgi:hypothetical protein
VVRGLSRAAIFGLALAGCDKEIVVGFEPTDASTVLDVGHLVDASADADAGGHKDVTVQDATADADGGLPPLTVPWSTGFENGFSDWSKPDGGGFCYEKSGGSYTIVTSPVHSGTYAAAFSVNTALGTPGAASQARCVRQGVLPPSAYYGAWYYVPAPAPGISTTYLWNLLHFQGASSPTAATSQSLWDLSLETQPDAATAPAVYDFLRIRVLPAGPPIPIGAWFHLEMFLSPAEASTGTFQVYVDGASVLQLSGLETDNVAWGQWYVGNYAVALTPTAATVYVDDVSISTSGP